MPALCHLHMDPEQPVPGVGDGMMTGTLPAEAIEAFVQTAGATAAFPLTNVELRHLSGELERPRPHHGALSALDGQYLLFAVGSTPRPDLTSPVRAQVAAIKDALAPWAARHMYQNFADNQRNAAPFWTEQAFQRLRQIKANVDPTDLIRANHPIPPAR